MKTAVVYARYSCDNQSEQSIEGQMHVCQEFANRNNILIVDTYIDRAMTGTNDNRPDFQRMIKDSAKKEWDYVLVYKLDRFSRNKYETAIHKKTLRDNGVKVLSAMENIPDTPEGIILESLLEGMNQYYSAELSQKVRRGMRETRRKGLSQGGPVLYGYKLVDRRYVIKEGEADVVRYAFDQYSKGIYASEIVEDLNRRGIKCRGKQFDVHKIYWMLQNEKYSGIYRHGDELIDNMFPPIVPAELYEKVRVIQKKNRRGKRSLKTIYMLRFKIRCGYCGSPIGAECGKGRDGKTARYYKCLGRKQHRNDCQKIPVRKEYLESLIVSSVIDRLNQPEILNGVVAEVMRMQNDQSRNNSVLTMLLNQRSGIEKSLENLVDAMQRGAVSKTTNTRLHKLEDQLDELDRQINIEKNKTVANFSEKDIRKFYSEALRLEPRMLITCLVKEVILYDDRMEIHYNTPLRTAANENSNASFSSSDGVLNENKKESDGNRIRIDMFVE